MGRRCLGPWLVGAPGLRAALGTPALCLPRAFPESPGVAGAGSRAPARSLARGDPAGKVRGGGGGASTYPVCRSWRSAGARGGGGGGVSTQSPRLLCHQVSRPMAGKTGKAGSLSRGGGDGKDQSPRSRPEERSLDVLWSLRGRETQ